jgi:hypothetical protein
MAKSGKGSSFERFQAVTLSLWFSGGKRDDLLWRSSMSGGRATVRSKQGKQTANQHGDLIATDPSILPLTDLVSIELKRGYSGVSFMDLLDTPVKNKTNVFAEFIDQCIREAGEGGKPFWWLIFKRDRREATITMPYAFMQKYFDVFGDFKGFSLRYTYKDIKLISCRLEDWLDWFKPEIVFGPFEE